MLQNIINFWKGKDYLTKVMKEFESMLLDVENMYVSVREALIKGHEEEGLRQKIYDMDKRINQIEKDIRTQIVEHLSLQPAVNLPVSLVLMSVVKDAERLGDYAKNLYEVKGLLEQPLNRDLFQSYFGRTDKNIISLIGKTRKAFIQSNETEARELAILEREIVQNCEAAIKKLAKGDLSSNLSVCFTLMARHYKRTAAHLLNIGTAVIKPLNELDFFDEKNDMPVE